MSDINIPIVLSKAGLQPANPLTLLANLIAQATLLDPGLTANLPGTLIEDIASTDTGALVVMDSALVDLINSITPYGANQFLLNQLGNIYGVQQGVGSNGSVFVIFSGPAGFLIAQGFTVSDGTNQYVVQDGGIIGSGGVTIPLFCVAVQPGTFAIPANTVNVLSTSIPIEFSVTCNNPNPGLPAISAQTEEQYRAQVIQAGIASAQGFMTYLKTQLQKISGVQPQLIAVKQVSAGWQIICGGGDPYQVAYAIFMGIFDVTQLVGSTLSVTGITNANPGVVTTDLTHGFATGQVIRISGVTGMSGVNNVDLTITVITPHTFSIGLDTTSSGTYTGGGVVTPNLRNVVVSIDDYPDTYLIPYIVPLQQMVAINYVWNTTSTNFISTAAVAQLVTPPLVAYINSIFTGQPINLFEMECIFLQAVSAVIAPQLISRMVITVSIDGEVTAPTAGTEIVEGDPQSYFFTTAGAISVVQG